VTATDNESRCCQRAGCGNRRYDLNRPGCSPFCGLIWKLQSQAGHLDAALGPSPATTEFRGAATDLAAALDRAFAARAAIRRAATDTGVTGSGWARLLQGNYDKRSENTSTPVND
jgi:hypothetical protein